MVNLRINVNFFLLLSIAFVPPLNLDEDMEDDDDFGDFEEPEAFTEHQTSDKFEAFASSSGWASLDSSPRGQIDQILIGVMDL